MAIALNLMAARQNAAQNTIVMWTGVDAGARSLVLIVARRRLEPDEIEQALTSGHPEVDRVSVPATAGAVQDDLTPPGEPRYYGLVALGADGAMKPARFRAGAMSAVPEGTVMYSALGGKAVSAAAAAPAPSPTVTGTMRVPVSPTSAPSPTVTGTMRVPVVPPAAAPTPTPAPTPAIDPMEARRQAQLRAQQAAAAAGAPIPTPAPVPAIDPMEARRQAQLRAQQASAPAESAPAPAIDPMEARRQAQLRAQQAAGGAEQPGSEAIDARRAAQRRATGEAQVERVAPPSDFPVARFGLRMTGATQSWDGLRIMWETEGKKAAAFEVFIADRPLSPDEVGELIGGARLDGASVRAFGAGVRAVIDNLTPRESRGYYAVVAREEDGTRHIVGCVAQSSDESQVRKAPFFAPESLDEVRELAATQVREAKAQLHWWNAEQDVSAWREALRVVDDALAIYPDFPAAVELRAQIQAARQL